MICQIFVSFRLHTLAVFLQFEPLCLVSESFFSIDFLCIYYPLKHRALSPSIKATNFFGYFLRCLVLSYKARLNFCDMCPTLTNVCLALSSGLKGPQVSGLPLAQWFSNCGTRTTSGTRRSLGWYAKRPTFCFSSQKIYSQL